MIRLRAALALLCITCSMATAQSVKLTADQITALLAGNTAVGNWQGTPYRQFFGTDGVTLYATRGQRTTRGDWRVDKAADEYQSLWPRDAAWEGWYVMEYAGDYYWVSKSTPPTPFRMIIGQRLVFDN